MTPLDHIRTGLQTKDWNEVTIGFEGLTGERIQVEEETTEFSSLMKKVSELENLITSRVSAPSTPPPPVATTPQPQTQKVVMKRSSIEDEMPAYEWESAMFKPESVSNIGRDPLQLIEVQCDACGKTEQVPPALGKKKVDAKDEYCRWTCSKCGPK